MKSITNDGNGDPAGVAEGRDAGVGSGAEYVSVFPCGRFAKMTTANLRAKILDFSGFDSSIILISRGGILTSIGIFLEILSRIILV